MLHGSPSEAHQQPDVGLGTVAAIKRPADVGAELAVGAEIPISSDRIVSAEAELLDREEFAASGASLTVGSSTGGQTGLSQTEPASSECYLRVKFSPALPSP